MTPDTRILAIARDQHAVFTRQQALDVGFTTRMIDGRLALGLWERAHVDVYRVAGAPATAESRMLAACLSTGADAAASHRAAAWLWDMNGPFAGWVEISMPRERATELIGVVTHKSSDLVPDDVTVRRGIAVTKPARTLVDLGAVCSRRLVDQAIDSALAKKLTTLDGLYWMLARVARKGRSGAGVLRRCLEWRFGVPESVLEGLYLQIVRDFDLPVPIVQYEIRVNGRDRRIDAAHPACNLAVELDGAEKRMSPAALQDDLTRQNDLVDAGFTVLRFTFGDLTLRRAEVAHRVRTMHARLSPVLGRVAHA